MFRVVFDNGCIERIYDLRYSEPVDITDGTGRFGHLAYTLKSQDLNEQLHPGCMPFTEQHAGFDADYSNHKFGSKLSVVNRKPDAVRSSIPLPVNLSWVAAAVILLL